MADITRRQLIQRDAGDIGKQPGLHAGADLCLRNDLVEHRPFVVVVDRLEIDEFHLQVGVTAARIRPHALSTLVKTNVRAGRRRATRGKAAKRHVRSVELYCAGTESTARTWPDCSAPVLGPPRKRSRTMSMCPRNAYSSSACESGTLTRPRRDSMSSRSASNCSAGAEPVAADSSIRRRCPCP